MNKIYLKAKAMQIIMFPIRILMLTIGRKAANKYLRDNGSVIPKDLGPLQLHRFFFKVYEDGST